MPCAKVSLMPFANADYRMPNIISSMLSGRRKDRPREGALALAVVGLGNPGPEYADTRHNAGFLCIDALARRHDIGLARQHRSAIVGEGEIGGRSVALVKPRTYVNRSGVAVQYLQARYSLSVDRLLVVYDDINLPPGKLRLRGRGSAGGHNGIKSVIETTGSQDFPRLRIGVGRPPDGIGQVEHVIGAMDPDERDALDGAVARAADAVACLLAEGIDETMSRFN